MRYADQYLLPSFLGLVTGTFAFMIWRAFHAQTMEGILFMVCAGASALLLGFILTHYQSLMRRVMKLEKNQFRRDHAAVEQKLQNPTLKRDILGLDPLEIDIRKSTENSNLTNVVHLHKSLDRKADRTEEQNNDIIINLQAVIEMKGRSVHAYEVLARMESADGNYRNAAEILDGFKKRAEFHYLDKTVLEQTVEVLKCLDDEDDLVMHINISRQTLESKSAFEAYMLILKTHVAIHDKLVLEISQQQFAMLSGASRKRLFSIVKLGFRLSIDNCTDYAPLVHLLEHDAIAVIKTPVTRFSDVEDQATERKMIALMKLCDARKVPFIVTHVDEGYQLQELMRYNVQYAQGFLFSAPKRPQSKFA